MSLFKTYTRAVSYLMTEKRTVIIICAANIAMAAVQVFIPKIFGWIIDELSLTAQAVSSGTAFSAGDTFTAVIPYLALWTALGMFSIIATVMVDRGADRLAHRRRLGVLAESYQRIINMPLAWHQKIGTSNALHTMLRACESMFTMWLEFMRQHLASMIQLVILLSVAIWTDYRLSIVLISLGIIYIMIARLVMTKTKTGQESVEKYHLALFEHVTDSISNVSVVQSYNRGDEESARVKQNAQNVLKAQYPVLNWWALAAGLNRMASTITVIVVIVLGAYLVSKGILNIGDVVAFVFFSQMMIGQLDQISNFINLIGSNRAKLDAFYDMMDSTIAAAEPEGLPSLTNVKGDIRFDHVTHEFSNTLQGVYDISFEIKPGQTAAIVGPTGAGKTTLINLLQRIYDPESGVITIDGVDTRTVNRASLRHAMATVFQDSGLFNRTIKENISIGRPEATDEEIYEAAKIAAANDFIRAKTNGYDTRVGERGSLLSGGERQRLAIARAVLKNSPIFVLDEATSALDVETEARVKEAIDTVSRNRTTIIIAHRLSTVRNADLVLFMDRGHIVEQGSFDELAEKGGRFTALLKAGGLTIDHSPHALNHDNVAQH
ncbi:MULTISPECIES: glucan ABC transporter ATP-binding protein/ permease [Bartonella]|uniref:ATP-binding cassette, subfamily B n=1 Tax=Bartonella choladocola TaxID=2750995 RepID=A0A1U9MHR5_9HYPH|nr:MULTISPECIES: glucan ABC transporter ATP-binding protein/ permease [Bartonella]AQT47487.1 ATP-binding cassette, subfamily B [Bartonella choladocola]MBH9975656.1 glucan ABC transporter ATP-binding protein/ permease [Bartonella choladocola]MBI0015263.1 glucan ABC transporter ATP-binding protein/ permease [Bartonella sp. B10834G3]MBI0140837.1 glucan ABC transporter ATP-binding protein/ permease [Bartonella choladocola]